MRGKRAKLIRRLADEVLDDAERHGLEIPKDGLVRLPNSNTAINRPGSRRATHQVYKRFFKRGK